MDALLDVCKSALVCTRQSSTSLVTLLSRLTRRYIVNTQVQSLETEYFRTNLLDSALGSIGGLETLVELSNLALGL